MDIYRDKIMDHYRHPRNFGHIQNPDASASAENSTCGDRIQVELKYSYTSKSVRQQKLISDIRFSGTGCAISQASASMLTEKIKGQTIKQAQQIKRSDIIRLLGTPLTPTRIRCATLVLEVLQKALVQ